MQTTQHLIRTRDLLTERNRLFSKTAEKAKELKKELDEKTLAAEREVGYLKIDLEKAQNKAILCLGRQERAEAELKKAQEKQAEAEHKRAEAEQKQAELEKKLREWEEGAKDRDDQNYNQGVDEASAYYRQQVREYMQKAYAEGYTLGLCDAEVPETSRLFKKQPSYPFPADPVPEAEKEGDTPASDKAADIPASDQQTSADKQAPPSAPDASVNID